LRLSCRLNHLHGHAADRLGAKAAGLPLLCRASELASQRAALTDTGFIPPRVNYASERPERDQSKHSLSQSLEGGFYFHPGDEDLSLGTPVRGKIHLASLAPGYIYSGSAIVQMPGAAVN
jgi:hypothetical protein